jgi:hypothetical protein
MVSEILLLSTKCLFGMKPQLKLLLSKGIEIGERLFDPKVSENYSSPKVSR